MVPVFSETPRRKGTWVEGKGEEFGDRNGLEPHLCFPEQVTRVELLSPELRGQLQALLLQRPQHLIWTTRTRPCCCERPLPGPPNSWVGEYQISPARSWTRIGLASAQTSTGTHGQGEAEVMVRGEEQRGRILTAGALPGGTAPGALHTASHSNFTTTL